MSGTMSIEYSTQIWKEGNQYIAQALPLDVMSAGPSPEEASKALDEAVHLFLVTAADMGTLEDVLQKIGYESTESPSPSSGATCEQRAARGMHISLGEKLCDDRHDDLT